jgi:hypothetical protein
MQFGPLLRQGNRQPPPTRALRHDRHQPAARQPIDHALDGGGVHGGLPAQQVLRQRPHLGQFRQRRPLRRGQLRPDAGRENRAMPLRHLAQNETNLVVEPVVALRTAGPLRLRGCLLHRRVPCPFRRR